MTHRLPTAPLLLTHLDPSLYPVHPLPLLHELVIHILAHGEVWLKEVDLFLNRRIRAQLSKPANLRIFAGLVDTGRVKILIPDRATPLDLDPQDHPLLATARARDNKKPLKSEPWVLTEETKQFCTRLDSILGHAARHDRNPGALPLCMPRVTPPSDENEFATKLYAVLTQANTNWRKRGPFGGISDEMATEFAKFCLNYDKALALLAAKNVGPNATNGFYRSLAYQCADQFPQPEQQPMKNLVQSVYAYCELKREGAAGTYSGDRMAEMPPDRPIERTNSGLLRVAVVPRRLRIGLTDNIGEVISAVLEECQKSMSVFWKLAGTSQASEQDFRVAWNHIAEVFAEKIAPPGRRLFQNPTLQKMQLILAGASLAVGVDSDAIAGFSWSPTAVTAMAGLNAIATFGPPTIDLIRSAQMDLKRQKISDRVSAAAAIRCSWIA